MTTQTPKSRNTNYNITIKNTHKKTPYYHNKSNTTTNSEKEKTNRELGLPAKSNNNSKRIINKYNNNNKNIKHIKHTYNKSLPKSETETNNKKATKILIRFKIYPLNEVKQLKITTPYKAEEKSRDNIKLGFGLPTKSKKNNNISKNNKIKNNNK